MFGELSMQKDSLKLIRPFKDILEKRKTVSDEILEFAGNKREISNQVAAELAVEYSGRLAEEIVLAREMAGRFLKRLKRIPC